MNKSKTVFPIGDHYEVVIYPKEDEFRLRDRIYEHFFTNVYPYMDIQEQEKISWNRDFFRFEKEDSKDDMQALEFLVKQQFGGDKLLPSWCLSRLWYLTNGNIVDAIASLHEPYSGELDGGVISISVLIEKEEIPLVLFQWEASADEGYLLAKLLDWSPQVTEEDALVILKNMNHWFLSDMNLLSVCSITIHNPEVLPTNTLHLHLLPTEI
ncbi:MAG: hypothetical protein HGA25_10840, partial [Clostridiales bacterium]|nr:hypothetical protein [Clostridiales bacterium]